MIIRNKTSNNRSQHGGSGAVGQSAGLANGSLGVRIPAAKDVSRKTGSDRSTAKRSAIGASVTVSRR